MSEEIIAIDKITYSQHRQSLISIYKECFAEPPYFEFFSEDKADEILVHSINMENNIFLAMLREDTISGAVIYFPIVCNHAVSSCVEGGYADAIYCADIFVAKKFQKKGIGRSLMVKANEIALDMGYREIILRTTTVHPSPVLFYKKLGFTETGFFMDCKSDRLIEGKIYPMKDERVFLVKDISEGGNHVRKS